MGVVADRRLSTRAQTPELSNVHSRCKVTHVWCFVRREMVVVDTVGFISSLPTQLVAAFHSTLEEILYADVRPSPYSDPHL